MPTLPQRISLAAETARVLREQISAGEWGRALPGERVLGERLRVSRPTLRAALDVLEKEGWITEALHGKRREITQPASEPQLAPQAARRVVLLSPTPLYHLPPFVLFWLNDLRQRLAEEQFELEVKLSHAAELDRPGPLLERLTSEAKASAWILYVSTEPMQRWFAARSLPCVVTGSSFAGLPLPSIALDHQATCRHAVGLFAARGHRRIALLAPEARTAGEIAGETGFLEGSQASAAVEHASIIRHDGSNADVCRKLDRLLERSPRITGLLVARSAHALTTLTHLQRRGLKLPQDLALISRDDDSFLDFVTPTLARYSCPPSTFARHVSRAVLQLVKEATAPSRQTLLMPDFIAGDTLDRARSMDG